MIDKKAIGLRISKARSEAGYTSQYKFGKALNTDQATINRWENGTNLPDMERIMKIAQVLNVSTDYILGLTDIKSTPDTDIPAICEKIHLSEKTVKALINCTVYEDLGDFNNNYRMRINGNTCDILIRKIVTEYRQDLEMLKEIKEAGLTFCASESLVCAIQDCVLYSPLSPFRYSEEDEETDDSRFSSFKKLYRMAKMEIFESAVRLADEIAEEIYNEQEQKK